MDSTDLRAFLAFADALNFTHAARAVHLSQPAVFAIVKRLGDDVGAALYEKRGRALTLTAAGERVVAHARDVVDGERTLRASLGGADPDVVCVLACGEGALTHVVADGVARFVKAHPRALRVVVKDSAGALTAVKCGEAHVGVVAGAVDDDEVSVRALRKSRVLAVGVRALFDSAEKDATSLSLAALAHMPLIVPARGRPLRKSIDDALASDGLTANVAVEASGWGALVMLARLGCGVALVNDVVDVRGLVALPVEGLLPVVYRSVARRRKSALAAALLRAMHE